ncbi:hypothetical protein PQX77_020266 [Marasmius sp. AFHP31]|nr:hypothetical protein PQX77_020266 [Marasmius sp. AFHP31]
MSRPKLYHTKAEHREANRVKNKRFYDKNKTQILHCKQVKRQEFNRALQSQEVEIRKKRRRVRETQRKKVEVAVTQPSEPVPTAQDSRLRELEEQLNMITLDYNKMISPNGGKYAEKLCEETISWKQRTCLSLMQQPTSKSPLLSAKIILETKLMEYQVVEDEYFYGTRDRVGEYWDERRENFTMFKQFVLEYIEMLGKLQAKVEEVGHTVQLANLSPIYRSLFCTLFIKAHKDRKEKNRRLRSIVRRESRSNTPGTEIAEEEFHDNKLNNVDDRYILDVQFYERHLRTLKTSLQRELNNDPQQYLEHIYQELILWKYAMRPIISPLEHPIAVLRSLEDKTKKVGHEIRFVVRNDSLMEQFNALNACVLHIYNCLNDLQIAVYEDSVADTSDDGTVSKYATLEERHESKSFKMFDSSLAIKYKAAGL